MTIEESVPTINRQRTLLFVFAVLLIVAGICTAVFRREAAAVGAPGVCQASGTFASASQPLSELRHDYIERSNRAVEWLKEMTGTRTNVTTDSTIALDQQYSPSYQGAVSGTFDLKNPSNYEMDASIEIRSPRPLDDSYRGVVAGKVIETPKSGRWIIQAYKRQAGNESQVPRQALADGTTGEFTIDLTGVDPDLQGEWVFGLLDAEAFYAPYGAKWPGSTYKGLEVRQYIVTDAEYYWSTTKANADGTFVFPGSNTGTKVIRLVDTRAEPDEVIAEHAPLTGLIRSYAYDPGEAGYGTAMEERSYVYDQALTIFAAIGNGEVVFAKQLVEGLLQLQTQSGDHEGGFVFAAPQLRPEFTDPLYRTGAHAIATDALLSYVQTYPNDPDTVRYKAAAHKALDFIDTAISSPQLITSGLYLGGYGQYSGNPEEFDPGFSIEWASTEHNIDIWHTFIRAAAVFPSNEYSAKAKSLSDKIIEKLYNKTDKRLNQGLTPSGPDTADPLDVNSWGAIQLYGVGYFPEAELALTKISRFEAHKNSVHGYAPFYDSPGYPGAVSTVWFEGSFGVALAQYRLGDYAGYRTTLDQLGEAQEADGSFRYATDRDPVYEIGVSRSVAATAWYSIATTGRDLLWNSCAYQEPTIDSPTEPSIEPSLLTPGGPSRSQAPVATNLAQTIDSPAARHDSMGAVESYDEGAVPIKQPTRSNDGARAQNRKVIDKNDKNEKKASTRILAAVSVIAGIGFLTLLIVILQRKRT